MAGLRRKEEHTEGREVDIFKGKRLGIATALPEFALAFPAIV